MGTVWDILQYFVWPVVALLIAGLLQGVIRAGVELAERRFNFDIADAFEEQLSSLADMAIDWVSHKLPRANGDPTLQQNKLKAAAQFVRDELHSRGVPVFVQNQTEQRLTRLIEGNIALRKRERGELETPVTPS